MSFDRSREVTIPIDGGTLQATLRLPETGKGLVVFAHGSGSSRLSPRNQFVAEQLCESGFGTLLLDLLTVEEDAVYENRFNIQLLAQRLTNAVAWATTGNVPGCQVAFFGASTGAAAALIAAARLGAEVKAVVSRGGRPDLAGEHLRSVLCPTLFIVGGYDDQVIELNRRALDEIPANTTKEMAIVPGATHLFEEPGTLEQVSNLATEWFLAYAVS